MKKTRARIVAATAEPIAGSPSSVYGGADIGSLYIDMLCEKFKNRGIKTGMASEADKQKSKEALSSVSRSLGIQKVSANEKKYRTMMIDGRSYMSSDDFATYYKDLRGNKMPNFYSRAEREYEEAAKMAESVQESGRSPKKAVWLAVTNHVKRKVKEIPSHLTAEGLEALSEEWFPIDKAENRQDGKKSRMPRGVIPVLTIVTFSLLLIVCSSVMVSRASAEVSSLEDRIEELEEIRDDLMTDLDVKNNMLDIKKIAVEEYGMISGDYAASRYLDITEDEKIENYDEKENERSLFSKLMDAIGFAGD